MVDFLQYIEETNSAENEEQIFELFQQQLAKLGFDRVLYTLATDHPSIDKKAGHGIMRNYPEDWMKHYTEKNYVIIDPVIKMAAHGGHPFAWSEMDKQIQFIKEQKKLLNEAKEAGLHCGIGLGIHGPNNEMVAMGFASSQPGVEIGNNTISLVKALANQFHFAYCEFQKRSRPISRPAIDINLTRKETEILKWLVASKSKSAIAAIVGVSENTVDYHMRSIYRKLEVNDRIYAVLKAMRYGLVEL